MRRTPAFTARILILAAAVAPLPAFPQPALEPAANEQQRQIVERIDEIASRDGSRSTDLIDPLTALAVFYQEQGDHAPAVATIERARQVVRINYGLYSLEEAGLIRQLIASEEARGNVEIAWDLEQQLLSLARRHRDDLRTVQIFRDMAEKRSNLLARYRAGEFPPQIVLGCYYKRNGRYDPARDPHIGNCRAGSRDDVVTAIVSEVMRHYAEAIRGMLEYGLYSSDALRELEMAAIRTAYVNAPSFGWLPSCPTAEIQQLLQMELLGSCLEPAAALGPITLANVGGITSLVRLLAYEVRTSAPAVRRMDALIQIADWQLLFSRREDDAEPTLAIYEQAYRQLEREGAARASIEQIFSPELPVVLPAFLSNPLASDRTSESTGYIDVAFDISRYGKSERIEVLGTSMNATRASEKDLIGLIKHSRFRPRVTDGELAETARVVVRYHLNGYTPMARQSPPDSPTRMFP